MSELAEIIAAFDELCEAGKPAALALVIGVEGSAYRRPGARMLIAEDGRTWGGVSGGCLERDVARRGRFVIASGRAAIHKYDTADDETGTGCGGTVEILIQPLTKQSPGPIPILRACLQNRCTIKLVTVIRNGISDFKIGTHFLLETVSSQQAGPLGPGIPEIDPALKGRLVEENGFEISTDDLFIETISPPQSLIIFGSGPDAVPLCTIAKTLGWHVTIVGARPATFLPQRFPQADVLHVSSSDDPLAGVDISSDSAVVVMTHNLARDERILSQLPRSLRYVGLLGPRHRAEKIAENISREPGEIFAPVGLDLGAQTPEEIALSIVAEIQAVIRHAAGASLRDQPGPIHARVIEQIVTETKWGRACQA